MIKINKYPYIIAELSTNHNQSLSQALKLVESAKKCGVDAIKLQTYTADSMTVNCKNSKFLIKDKKSLWKKKYLYDLYKKGSLKYEFHKPIFNYAKKLNLDDLSTPGDIDAVNFLEKLNVKFYKIASFEITDNLLIEAIAKTKKKTFISTGMASINEINNVVKIFKKHHNYNYVLLKCTSNYPSDPKNSNIKTILDLKKKFNCEIGISDHTKGIGVAIAATVLGASVIEKHFKLNHETKSLDKDFSLNPEQMKKLVVECKSAIDSLGQVHYGPTIDEKKSLYFRRSIIVKKNIKKGDYFSYDNIGVLRPNIGAQPSNYLKIIGKKSKKSYKLGDPVK